MLFSCTCCEHSLTSGACAGLGHVRALCLPSKHKGGLTAGSQWHEEGRKQLPNQGSFI